MLKEALVTVSCSESNLDSRAMADLSGSYATMSQAAVTGPRRHGMIEEGLLAITLFCLKRIISVEGNVHIMSLEWFWLR